MGAAVLQSPESATAPDNQQGEDDMASIFKGYSVASGGNVSIEIQYAASKNLSSEALLPYFSVVPIDPGHIEMAGGAQQWYSGGSFPVFNMLGVSTQWMYLTDDLTTLKYYMNVMNNGPGTVEFNLVYTNF
jgi:hypothetical protein